MPPIGRRQFTRESAAGALWAALASRAAGRAWAGAPASAFGLKPFAGALARCAAVADCLALARAAFGSDDKLPPGLRDAQGLWLPGAVAPLDGAALRLLIEPARQSAAGAVPLGAVCFFAADRHLRRFDGTPEELNECLVYRDAAVIRGRFGLPGAPPLQPADVESLFRALLQRTLMLWHTFIVDSQDESGWIERALDALGDLRAAAAAHARALCQPDPAALRRFTETPPTFRAEDALVAAARADRPGGLDRAAAETPQSLYGMALRDGFAALRALHDHERKRISWDDLCARLGIPT
jgi:hypothetical protein